MAGSPRGRPGARGSGAGPAPHPEPHRSVATLGRLSPLLRHHRVPQHHPGRAPGPLPGRLRARADHPSLRTLERHGHGGPGQQAHQRGRAHRQLRLVGHALRRGLQPLLARLDGGQARRPDLHPGTLRARHLRPRLPARACSARSSSTTSARRWTARGCPRTRTPGSCPTSGSSRPCRWGSGRSWPSTRRGSCATCPTAACPTPPAGRCGRCSATARWTSPSPWAPSAWPAARSSTTWSSW